MLRSIFSLIQRIIDSDKKYNNTKSHAVIYCFSNPDNTVNMDLEIDGKSRKTMKNLQFYENKPIDGRENAFTIKTEQGDSVTCRHNVDVKIEPKESTEPATGEGGHRVTFANDADKSENDTSRDGGDEEEAQMKVKNLVSHFPLKQMDVLSSKEKDQISSLLEQIQKMKTGLERLKEIAHQFNYSERFGEDVNFLINNVRPYLLKNASKDTLKDSDVSLNNPAKTE